MCGIQSNESLTRQLSLVKKYLKLKLLEDNITFRGHEKEKNHVYDIIKRTIVHGESHSALMIGPRETGKTTLINSVINQLSKEVDLNNDALIIRLNGLIHHDNKIALKSITAQMQLENAVGDRVFGTFAENLQFLLSCLQSGKDRKCKSMVFLLDEFEMFCSTGTSQTLLYNLFDITHSHQAPLAVICITNRLDVMDLLEKRVKSRFSHRHIMLFPYINGDSPNNDTRLKLCTELFEVLMSLPYFVKELKNNRGKSRKKSLAPESMDNDSQSLFALPNEVLERCYVDPQQFTELETSFIEEWNAHIKAISKEDLFVDSLEKMCYYTVNEQIFRNVLFQLISQVSAKKPYINPADLSSLIDKAVSAEHRVKLLQSLSILELSLIIAMKHGMEIFDGQPVNFEMVLHRYTKFANSNSSAQTVPRPVILKAFEHLQELEIIMPVRSTDSLHSSSDSRVQKEYQLFHLAVPVYDINEAVKGFKALPTEISHWCNNSVF